MTITKDENKNLIFNYSDPLGTPIELRPSLVDIIKELDPNAKIIDQKTVQQRNAYDCGAFVVDNLIKTAQGKKIMTTIESGNMGGVLRQRHAQIINQEWLKQEARSIVGQSLLPPATNSFPPNKRAGARLTIN